MPKIDTDKIIAVNWFDKEALENVLREDLTDEEYRDFKNWLEDESAMHDNATEDMREYWKVYNEEED